MAITDISNEVEKLRAEKQLQTRIEGLNQEQAVFVLKALLAAGHVSEHTMTQALNLADTITWL